MTRSAVSIPSNIAEGSSRRSEKEYARFIEMSLGSSFELETQLIISEKLSKGDRTLLQNLKEILLTNKKCLPVFNKNLILNMLAAYSLQRKAYLLCTILY